MKIHELIASHPFRLFSRPARARSIPLETLDVSGKGVAAALIMASSPLISFSVAHGSATSLVKNNLMDNLAADYVRTAIAKGVSFRKAVTGHALRNSMIPVATTFGQNVTLLVTGSFLIETIFDINGFGLLGLSAIFDRDYPIVMGVVLLSSFLLLVGNILSDIIVALVDPRVRFQ